MLDRFEEFGAIVLDSSLLFSRLDDSFFKLLSVFVENNGALFRYPAFSTEANELLMAVDSSTKIVSQNNSEQLNALNITSFKAKDLNGDCGCESLIFLLLSQEIEVAVATTNKLLIERLVLNNISVSIINPAEKGISITRPTDFETHKQKSDVLALATPSAIPYARVGEGVRLKCGDDSEVTLTSIFNSGGKEAVIYNCDRTGVVAKIFKEGILTDAKIENIRNFISFNNELPWLVCPIDILYVNATKSSCPVGYLMKCIDDVTDIGAEELFVGDIDCLSNDRYKETKPSYVADVCSSILRQVIYLHMNGVLFGDYNGGNFALKNDGSTDYVTFFDTDGYGYKKNPVVSAAAEFENPRAYDLHDKRDLLRSEYDNLCIAVFRWMTLGMLPYVKDANGNWQYRDWHNETEQRKARWTLLPTTLQKLFNKVFGEGEVRTPTELLFALKNAYKKIVTQPSYSEHFANLLSSNQPQVQEPVVEPKPEIKPEKAQPKPAVKPPGPPQPPPPSPPKKKTKPEYLLFAIIAIAVGLAIWWFGFGHVGWPLEPQLVRHDTDNGYYLSYSPELDGYIEYHWNNGNVYKGDFVSGSQTGKGEYLWASGGTYTGDFVDGQLTGSGTWHYPDGSSYRGELVNGVRNGQGTLYNSDGDEVYEGGWKDDLFNGQGTYCFPNVVIYKDTWENGTCNNGEAVNLTLTSNDKPAAKGYWSSNVFHGSYYDNGQWYELP